jgi:hypothetical protein
MNLDDCSHAALYIPPNAVRCAIVLIVLPLIIMACCLAMQALRAAPRVAAPVCRAFSAATATAATSSTAAQTVRTIPNDLKATYVDGKWRKAKLSGRQAAVLRKRLVMASLAEPSTAATTTTEVPLEAFWNQPRASVIMRAPKGTRHDLAVAARVASITAARSEKAQEKRLADYKKTLPPKPLAEGLVRWVKKNAWEKE